MTLEEALGCSLVADGGVGPETMGQLFPVIALQTGHKGVIKATLQCSCDLCDTLRVGRWEEWEWGGVGGVRMGRSGMVAEWEGGEEWEIGVRMGMGRSGEAGDSRRSG